MAGRLDIYEGVIKLKDEFSGNLEKARLKMLGFDSTNKVTMANMGRLAGIGFGALVAGGAAAGGTMALLAQQTAETGDHFAKLSQKTGMTTEFLSGLNHAMEMSGGNTTQMAMALKGFEKRMVFATEGVNEYSRAYDTLGISVKDQSGNLKKSEDLLMEVADKFAKLKDGAQKTTLAVKIFNDEGGLAMIPMLNEGAAGIKKLTEEAERLGLVWSGEDAAAAAQFSDQLDLLTKAGTGLAQTIGKELIPYGIALVRNFQEWTSGAQGFTGLHLDEHIKTIDAALVGVTPVVKTFAVGGLTIAQAFDSAGRLLGNFAATAQALARGDLKVALAMATDPGDPSAWDDYMSRVQAILNAEAPKLSSILSPQQIEVSVKAKADTSGGMDLPVLGKPQKEEDAQAVWAAYVARLEAMGQARDQEIAQEVADMEEFYRRLEEMGQGRVRQTVAEAEAIARNHEMALELGLVSEEQAAAASKAARDARLAQELGDVNMSESRKQTLRDQYRLQDIQAERQAMQTKMAMAEGFMNYLAQIIASYNQMATSAAQQQTQAIQESYDADVAAAREKLNTGAISQEQYDEWMKKRQEQVEKDKAAIANAGARKAFEAQKKFAIAQAVISTAKAVVGALAGPPPFPWSIPLALAAGLAGAAQIAVINSQQPPSYHQGGISRKEQMALVAKDEAHVPLLNGQSIPVSMPGGGPGGQALEVTIVNVVDPSAFSTPPDAIVNVIDNNVKQGGVLKTTIRKALG